MPATCGTVSLGSWPNNSIGEDTAVQVRFGLEFDAVPVVVAFFSAIDAASPDAKRIEVWTSDEARTGFRLHARSWDGANTYGVVVSWVASSDPALVQLGTLPVVGAAAQGAASPETPESEPPRLFAEFPQAFACAPDMAFGLCGLDVAAGIPGVRLLFDDLGARSRGWGLRRAAPSSDKVQSAHISWIASASPAVMQIGTAEVGSADEPVSSGSAACSVDVHFGKEFDCVPDVAVALAGFDVDGTKHMRVHTWAETLHCKGFTLKVRSWEDSVTQSVRVSWVATPRAPSSTWVAIPPHQPPSRFMVDGPPLGQGFCAVTHRARSCIDGALYAVKTSRYPFAQNERALKQELHNLMLLPVHTNLLRFFGSSLEADRLHIITDYVDGLRFADLLPAPCGKYKQRHAVSTVLKWISQLFDGLVALHAVGLVHRDLHNENVLVERAADGTPSDGPRAVRLIDFGAAGSYGLSTSSLAVAAMAPRMMSQKAGWAQYFSPERKAGAPFDDRDDIWAAGCHLAELSSGRAIRQLEGCGVDGEDFAVTPGALGRIVQHCADGPDNRCRDLANMVLVAERDHRPRAIAACDMARRLHGPIVGIKRPHPGHSGRSGSCGACVTVGSAPCASTAGSAIAAKSPGSSARRYAPRRPSLTPRQRLVP